MKSSKINTLNFDDIPLSSLNDSIIIINNKGLIIQWEAAAEKTFGYKKKSVLNKHISILLSNFEKEKNEIIKHILSEQKLLQYETILLDSSLNPVNVKLDLIPNKNKSKTINEYILIIQNISNEKKLEKENQELLNFQDTFFNNINFGILIIDRDTNQILFANSFAKELLNIQISSTIWNFLDSSELEKAKQFFSINSDFNPNMPYEFRLFNPVNKTSFYVDAYFSKIYYQNRPCLLFAFYNTTDKKNYLNRLEATIKKQEFDSITKSRYLANMSHELRSPINIILGYLEILLSENYVHGEVREFLTYINKSAEHLLKTLNDILDLSKAEAGKLKLSEKPYNLIALMKSVLSLIEVMLIGKKIALDYNSSIESDAYFIIDAHNLQRVLLNILTNAVKFTHEGLISVNVKYQNGVLVFSISDTGIGMTESELAKIFTPFEQAHPEISHKYGGTGLGLALSKEICALWGGNIKIESQKGYGTTVTFTYPAKRTEETDETEAAVVSPNLEVLKTKRILVVDDQEYNHKLFKLMLNVADVETIFSGKLAINKLITENFDGLLLDLHLIDINGMEVLKEIQKRERLSNLKIVVTSADILSNLKQQIEEMGYTFIPKPVKRIDLINSFINLFTQT